MGEGLGFTEAFALTASSLPFSVQPEEINQPDEIEVELAKHPEVAAGGEYRVSLAWKSQIDMDLVVLNVKTNETVYWSRLKSSDGNVELNLDNQGTKKIPDEEKTHVENISFKEGAPGVYAVYVNKYAYPRSSEDIPFTVKLKLGPQKTQSVQTAWNIKQKGQGASSTNMDSILRTMIYVTTINHN